MCHVWAMISTYVVNCLKLVVQLCRQDFVICLCVLIDISILETVYVPDSMWCELFVPDSNWESIFKFSLKSGFCLILLKEAKSTLQFFFRIPRPSSCFVVGMMVQFGPSVRPSVLVDYIFCPHECVAAWPFVRLKDGITL